MAETTVDEHGRIHCKQHHLAHCHICCMDFSEMNDEIDATPSDRE